MDNANDDIENPQVDAAIAEYLESVERGAPLDKVAFLVQHANIAAELRDFLTNYKAFEQIAPRNIASATENGGGASTANDSHVPRESLRLPRAFGNFELLEEIARGGMGVIFKARQFKPNRTVALKMILAGQLASPDDVNRFAAEAHAAAALDHPNIVPIFEVGQHDGQHYFTMAFVEGKSLAQQLANGPLAPREAAQIIRDVARAVEYAHEHGVVHRDLKPANILLDNMDRVRVTDFGLAKRQTEDTGLTGTGQLLGTPSFMSPEQVTGDPAKIGPPSDIYSLGATLYALMTGRPPFQAANTIDILRQALEKEPVAPRQLDASLPRDLETIALKCLQKDVTKRYASARDLADDLERFLSDRPILARRSTTTERFARWCRRNPLVAGLMGAVAALLVAAVTILAISNGQIRRESAARAAALQEKNVALQKAREAVDQLLVRVSEDKLFDVPQADPIRRGLLQDALGFYESFINLNEQDPSLRFQLAEVVRRSATIENSFAPDKARELIARSIQLLDELVRDSPDNYDFRYTLAKALEDQCYFWQQIRTAEASNQAEASALRCLEIRRALQSERPAVVQNTCNVLYHLGRIAKTRRDSAAATKYWQQGIDNARAIVAKVPTDVAALGTLHSLFLAIANQPTCKEREQMLKEALAAAEAQAKARDNFSAGRYSVGESKYVLASYYRDLGRREEAVELSQQCWREMASVCADRPNITSAWRTSRSGLALGVKLLRQLGRDDEAIKWANEFRQWVLDVKPKLIDKPAVVSEYFDSQSLAADCLRSLGRVDQADEIIHQAVKQLDGLPSTSLKHSSPQNEKIFEDVLVHRANEHGRQSHWPEAAADALIAIDAAPDYPTCASPKKRLCLWAAATPPLFDELQRLRPDETTLWIGHAQQRALCNDWTMASKDYARVIEKRPISDEWFEYAYALLLIGDQDGYERLCKKLTARIGTKSKTYDLYVAARTCSIGTKESIAASKVCDWADRSLEDRPMWKLHAAGLAHLRAGQFQQASKLFEESVAPGKWDSEVQGQNWFGLAIAHKKMGNDEEAHKCLEKGRALFKAVQPADAGQPSPLGIACHWMGLTLLSREAEQCLQVADVGTAKDTRQQ